MKKTSFFARAQATKTMSERFRTGGRTRGVWRMKKKDGSYVRLEAHGTVLPNVDNNITLSIVRPVNGI